MRTTFSGISIALRALQAQQHSLDITGHNVANVNNPNFSRQSALHAATRPYPMPMMGYTPSSGQMGTGVEISQIVRMRDSFVEMRLRQQLHSLNYWESLKDGLTQVELFFNEPTENGIHAALDLFWDSLQDLSREPEFEAVREVVVQRAQVVVEAIRNTREHLQEMRENLNTNIPIKVSEVNSLAARIADLNVQIGKISATGSLPNDLMDSRDALLEDLSKLVDIEVVQDHAHMIGVTIGGASLVHRSTSYELGINAVPTEEENYAKNEIFWTATGGAVEIKSGEIGGMRQLRDQEVQDFMDKLDKWTFQFADAFNKIHNKGYDLDGNGGGEPLYFFVFDNSTDDDGYVWPEGELGFAALNIRVNPNIAENVRLIRASSKNVNPGEDDPGAVGNGLNALELARLRFTPPRGSEITIEEAFNAIISNLGVVTQKSLKMVENEKVLANHLTNLRESVSGVSLDEEMANMIRFQHAYGAAARMMTAVDETLDVIINRLGIVGR
ncbi:MAG: flagellar hook-associated protein FlgK [Firmicutes bacterium]|nr:flagellar hook-associated protein FlgK [Bacillota bacterium]